MIEVGKRKKPLDRVPGTPELAAAAAAFQQHSRCSHRDRLSSESGRCHHEIHRGALAFNGDAGNRKALPPCVQTAENGRPPCRPWKRKPQIRSAQAHGRDDNGASCRTPGGARKGR